MSILYKTKKVRKLRRGEQSFGMALASIPLWGWLVFGMLPLASSLVLAFCELHSTDLSEATWLGWDNFVTILTNADNYTYGSYISTILYVLIFPVASIGVSLWVAYMINRTKIGKKFFRSVFFIPYVCSSAVITLTFKLFLYSYERGMFNSLLESLGFEPIYFLASSPWLFMACVIVMDIWSGLGYRVLLLQAALANVDNSYYEAATLDGANEKQMFWKITFKAISPTVSYLLTMGIIGAWQAMESFMLLAGEGGTVPSWGSSSAWVSDTVTKHIYNMIFVRTFSHGYGLAAAGGWILTIIILIVTRINMKTQEKWVCYDF